MGKEARNLYVFIGSLYLSWFFTSFVSFPIMFQLTFAGMKKQKPKFYRTDMFGADIKLKIVAPLLQKLKFFLAGAFSLLRQDGCWLQTPSPSGDHS